MGFPFKSLVSHYQKFEEKNVSVLEINCVDSNKKNYNKNKKKNNKK
jgi:hypothetical protein